MSEHWRAQSHAKWPRGCRKFQHPVESNPCHATHPAFTVIRLNHLAINLYQSLKESGIWLVVSRNLEPFFCVQNLHSRIAQVEYQSQTRNTRILARKPFDYQHMLLHWTWIGFSFSASFAQCSSSSSSTSEQWELRGSESLKFRTDLQDLVMAGWSVLLSVTQQIIHVLFNSNEVAVMFEIRIWADSLFSESRTGRWIGLYCLHRNQLRTCWFVPMSYVYSETNEW